MRLYDNIRRRREELGISQQELADRLGYSSRSTITKIEKGERDLTQKKIVDFAKALNTTAADLMGWADSLDKDDFEFIKSLGYIKPTEELPEDIAAINIFLYQFGEKIIRVNGNYYLGECGLLSDTDLEYLKESAIASLRVAFEMMKNQKHKELCSNLGGKK